MKGIINISLLFILLIVACSTPKNNNNSNPNGRMNFTITKIQNEKDGQTISMKDTNGGKFITVISPANGNFVELNEGDEISLVAEEIMESHPAQVISKDIKVLEKRLAPSSEYEKTEEEIYWIHAQKTMANNMMGNPIECLQFQIGEKMDKDGEWDVVCDEITHFDYREGNFYQIRVLKKWLKDHEFLADRTPYDLELVTVISKEKDPTYKNPSQTIISTDKKIYQIGEAIMLSFELKNNGKKPFTFLPWQTPLEKRLTGDCIQIIHGGKTVPYSGMMVKRMPPTEADYLTLQPGESTSATIDISNDYKLTAKSNYTIQFKKSYDGMPASNELEIEIK